MNDDRNLDPMAAELLSQHALQCLAPEDEARVQRMLADDPALARDADELRRVVDLLPLITQCAPPPHLRARVLAATRTATNTHSNVRQLPARRWPLIASLAFAAAASLACAVLVSERAVEREQWAQERAQDHQQWARERERFERQLELKTQAASMLLEPNIVKPFPLDALNAGGAALGYVLLDLDARRASIAVLDLPAAPQGYSYHLWAVLESKKVPCGRFKPEADGRVLEQFPIPVDSYTSPIQKLILTVEPDSDQTTPRGTTVMTS
jgi:hypothetical protein